MALTFLLLHGTSEAKTDAQTSSTIDIYRTESAPKIDGVIDEEEWNGSTKVSLNYQIQPGDNSEPTERTDVFLAYNKEYLLIAVHAYDTNPQGVRARVTRRDDVFKDDYLVLYLDTYNDRQRAYCFYFNPLGIQADGLFAESQTGNLSGHPAQRYQDASDLTWDGILESKGRLTADGYTIEAAIPFKTMRFKAGENRQWGIHLQRWIARKAELISWRPVSRDTSGLLVQMGEIGGLKDVYEGRTLDVIPTITASASGERQIDGRLNNVNKVDPGLTVNWALTPNLVFSATANPDFSQVESDVPQIIVNQRFPLFYPEKRPFFLEGAEIFRPAQVSAAALTLVDTRQIVDPDWGVKLTGKIGRNSIGLLSASDNAQGRRLKLNDLNFGKNALFNILRYKRDVGRDSSLGAYFTDYRFAGSSNSVIAGDGKLRFGKAHVLAFQLVGTRLNDPDGNAKYGAASFIRHTYEGRRWKTTLLDTRIEKDYLVRTGFTRRTGIRRQFGRTIYDIRPENNRWLVAAQPYVVGAYNRTREGFVDESYLNFGSDFTLPKGTSVYGSISFNRDNVSGRSLDYKFYQAGVQMSRFRLLNLSANFTFGEGPRYDPTNPGIGNRFDIDATVTIKPNNRLSSEFLYIKSSLKDQSTSARLFNQDIIRNRTVFQFTRYNALRSIIEYDTFARRAGLSFLYAYTPKPNTALYVGYSDLLYNGFDPIAGRRSDGLFRQSRTLFTKLTYNFRF